jgi:FG-GAP-like repeat
MERTSHDSGRSHLGSTARLLGSIASVTFLASGCATEAGDDAGSWVVVKPSATTIGSLAIGDFNGDGKDDVFHASGSTWQYIPGGPPPSGGSWGLWQTLRASTDLVGVLGFGRFETSDNVTDVFRADGTNLKYSKNGTGNWVNLSSSGRPRSAMAFPDLDGDGFADVFYSGNGVWEYRSRGQGPWVRLLSSDTAVDLLRFGRINGDAFDDIVMAHGDGEYPSEWRFFGGGVSPLGPAKLLAVSGYAMWRLKFADMDGDGKADALMSNCL